MFFFHCVPIQHGYSFAVFLTQNFTKAGEPEAVRCDTEQNLKQKGCPKEKIINPLSNLDIIQNKPLSGSEKKTNPVQVSPQEIRLVLRPGML